MYANAIRAMDAVRSAVQAASMPSSDELDQQIAESLSLLSSAMGASRACLCFVGVGQHEDVIERFFTGGDPDVLPVGPALLGVPLRQIPELAAVLDSDGGCVVVETQTASDAFSRIFGGSKFDWIASNALRDGDAVISVLILVGRGETPDPAHVPCMALSAISEAMRPVIRGSSPTAVDESIKTQLLDVVDSLGLGVVVLDDKHRIRYGNHIAETILGAALSELQEEEFKAEEWDLRSADGTPATSAAVSEAIDSPSNWNFPMDLQIRNRAGRTVLFRVGVGAIERWHRAKGGDRRAVLLLELTDSDDPARPVKIEDSQAEFIGLLASLRTALDDLEDLRGARSLSRSLPPAFDALTVRETEILNYLLEGVRVSTIAQSLYLSQHTVRNHLRAIFKKVGVTSQAELIRLARGLG